jgi:hypothetical protein
MLTIETGIALQSVECPRSARHFPLSTGSEFHLVDVPVGINLCQSTNDALARIRVLRVLIHDPSDWIPSPGVAILRGAIQTHDHLGHLYRRASPSGYVHYPGGGADSS